ncbi:MAG TPA: cyclic nucleotide-binding domain-containing protein, partial [Caulobacteraceae bacterium]|nr:cyclic nucleotide-binding domain-containing protein [Caulobacteraceae bacterium]
MQAAQTYPLKTAAISAFAPTHANETQDDLKLMGVAKSVCREREIFAEGDSTDIFYKVVSGTVRSLRFLSDGRRQITSFFLPGDIFGVDFGSERGTGAEAVSDAVVIQVRRSAILADPEQSIRLWRRSVGELRRSQ